MNSSPASRQRSDRADGTLDRQSARGSDDDLKAGIFQVGLGNFHRAHQAVYLNCLFDLGVDHDWAIIGTGVRGADEAMRQKYKEQDYLTTVVEQEAHSTAARVT